MEGTILLLSEFCDGCLPRFPRSNGPEANGHDRALDT